MDENQICSRILLKRRAAWLNMVAKIVFIVFLIIFNVVFWIIALLEHLKSAEDIMSLETKAIISIIWYFFYYIQKHFEFFWNIQAKPWYYSNLCWPGYLINRSSTIFPVFMRFRTTLCWTWFPNILILCNYGCHEIIGLIFSLNWESSGSGIFPT